MRDQPNIDVQAREERPRDQLERKKERTQGGRAAWQYAHARDSYSDKGEVAPAAWAESSFSWFIPHNLTCLLGHTVATRTQSRSKRSENKGRGECVHSAGSSQAQSLESGFKSRQQHAERERNPRFCAGAITPTMLSIQTTGQQKKSNTRSRMKLNKTRAMRS